MEFLSIFGMSTPRRNTNLHTIAKLPYWKLSGDGSESHTCTAVSHILCETCNFHSTALWLY